MSATRQILLVTFAIVSGLAVVLLVGDLMIWINMPDYWQPKPVALRHDMMGSEIRHLFWTVRQQAWPFIWMPLIPLSMILIVKRSLLGTGLGKATIVAFAVYYLSLATFVWPFVTARQ